MLPVIGKLITILGKEKKFVVMDYQVGRNPKRKLMKVRVEHFLPIVSTLISLLVASLMVFAPFLGRVFFILGRPSSSDNRLR